MRRDGAGALAERSRERAKSELGRELEAMRVERAQEIESIVRRAREDVRREREAIERETIVRLKRFKAVHPR